MQASKDKASEILGLGKRGLLKADLLQVAQDNDVKLSDRPTRDEITEALTSALLRGKGDKVAKAIVGKYKEKKPKKAPRSRSHSRTRKGKGKNDEPAVDANASDIIDGDIDDGSTAVVVVKTPPASRRNSVDLSVQPGTTGSTLGVDDATGYIFSAAPRLEMINALDGGCFDSNDGCIEVPKSTIIFATKYDIADSLAKDSNLLPSPQIFVMRPEGLVYGEYEQKLPCAGASVTSDSLSLLDLSNGTRAAAILLKASRKLGAIMSSDDALGQLQKIGIDIKDDSAIIKFSNLMNRMVTLADAPELIGEAATAQWGLSVSELVLKLAEPMCDGAVFTVHLGTSRRALQIIALTPASADKKLVKPAPGSNFAKCDLAKEWLDAYDSNRVTGSLIDAWKFINLCPDGACLQTSSSVRLKNGISVQMATIPSLAPLYSLNLALDAAFKRGSGVVPLWFSPHSMQAFASTVKDAVKKSEAIKQAENAERDVKIAAAIKPARLVPEAKSKAATEAESEKTGSFAALTGRAVTLLDLRMPVGPDAKDKQKVDEARKRIVNTISALAGKIEEPIQRLLADRFIGAAQDITNVSDLSIITKILAAAVPTHFPAMSQLPSGWVASVRTPGGAEDSFTQVVFLLDEHAAGWQVNNWLSVQSDNSDGSVLLQRRFSEAAKQEAMKTAGTGSLTIVARRTSKQVSDIGRELDDLLDDARFAGRHDPKLIWNGSMASFPDPKAASRFPTYSITPVGSSDARSISIDTISAGTYLLLGAFFVAPKDVNVARPPVCAKIGLMPAYPRGGSSLIKSADQGFDWAWSVTKTDLRMLYLGTESAAGIMALLNDMRKKPQSSDYIVSGDDYRVFEALIGILSQANERTFSTTANALISQGQKSAYDSNKGDECLAGIDASKIAAGSAGLVALQQRLGLLPRQDWYGVVERVLAIVSRYYGLNLDGWFISKPLDRSSPACSVAFGLLNKQVLHDKCFALGIRAPGSGLEVVWRAIREKKNERQPASAGFAVPQRIQIKATGIIHDTSKSS
jgi:hypothetical protein